MRPVAWAAVVAVACAVLYLAIINVALAPAEGLRCFPVLTPHDAYACGRSHTGG